MRNFDGDFGTDWDRIDPRLFLSLQALGGAMYEKVSREMAKIRHAVRRRFAKGTIAI
jgi:hypothetical protein